MILILKNVNFFYCSFIFFHCCCFINIHKDGVEDLDEENPQNELRSNEFDLEEEEEEEEDDEHIKDLAEQEERAKEKSNINKMLQDYIYDEEHHLWCQLTFNVKQKIYQFSLILL